MAKLSSLKINSKAIADGVWVNPGEEFDGLEIKTRGFTDAYNDARNARMRRLATGFGGNVEKIPSAMQREVIVDCLLKHVLLDVRGLENEDGSPVTMAQYGDLMRDPDFEQLFRAAVSAVSMAGSAKDADLEDAVGN